MNFYQSEILQAALADELADRFAATLAGQYGDEVAQFIARQPDNMDSFSELARQAISILPEPEVDELFAANVDAVDTVLDLQYAVTDPQRAAATLTARRLIRRKEVQRVAPVC